MGKPNFLFAGLAAALLAVATAMVAFAYDLPIRDPDGAGGIPTYVRLPAILLLAVLVDVVPRAIARHWPSPLEMLRGCLSVTRERWGARHLIFAFSGLGVWYLAYVAFRNLKSYRPGGQRHPLGHHPGALRPRAVAGQRPGNRAAPTVRDRLGG